MSYLVAESSAGERRIPVKKGERYPPEILTPTEVHSLLRACGANPETELRDRALLTVFIAAVCGVAKLLV
jgi:site-specific recombinase XerD